MRWLGATESKLSSNRRRLTQAVGRQGPSSQATGDAYKDEGFQGSPGPQAPNTEADVAVPPREKNCHLKTKNLNIVFASPLIWRRSCFSGNGPLGTVWGRLVAYCSKQAHSSVERAGMLAGVTMHQIHTDDLCRLIKNLLSPCVFILLTTFSGAFLSCFSLPFCKVFTVSAACQHLSLPGM
jgi:hypothetical protein